jgi:predicted RNA-binding Zn-ribbon protein involved in translation (DUF1610 family)
LEKEFGVPYDRDREIVLCPECRFMIVKSEVNFEDYTSYTEDGYVVYNCPHCGKTLTCRAVEA